MSSFTSSVIIVHSFLSVHSQHPLHTLNEFRLLHFQVRARRFLTAQVTTDFFKDFLASQDKINIMSNNPRLCDWVIEICESLVDVQQYWGSGENWVRNAKICITKVFHGYAGKIVVVAESRKAAESREAADGTKAVADAMATFIEEKSLSSPSLNSGVSWIFTYLYIPLWSCLSETAHDLVKKALKDSRMTPSRMSAYFFSVNTTLRTITKNRDLTYEDEHQLLVMVLESCNTWLDTFIEIRKSTNTGKQRYQSYLWYLGRNRDKLTPPNCSNSILSEIIKDFVAKDQTLLHKNEDNTKKLELGGDETTTALMNIQEFSLFADEINKIQSKWQQNNDTEICVDEMIDASEKFWDSTDTTDMKNSITYGVILAALASFLKQINIEMKDGNELNDGMKLLFLPKLKQALAKSDAEGTKLVRDVVKTMSEPDYFFGASTTRNSLLMAQQYCPLTIPPDMDWYKTHFPDDFSEEREEEREIIRKQQTHEDIKEKSQKVSQKRVKKGKQVGKKKKVTEAKMMKKGQTTKKKRAQSGSIPSSPSQNTRSKDAR